MMVSVVIPTYNHVAFVLEAIESVRQQFFYDIEIIVVNDGSPDETSDALKPIVASGSIEYIEQTNQGQAAARNRGLAKARGKFIAFLDDDDVWPLDKIMWQVGYLEANSSVSLVFGSAKLVGPDKEYELPGRDCDHPVFEDMFGGSPLVSPGQGLFRRSVLDAVGGFDESVWGADDHDLYFRISQQSTIHFVNRVALIYRLHPSNASKQVQRMYRNSKRVVHRYLKFVPANRRRRMRWKAEAFLYDNYARRLKADVVTNVKRLKFREALAGSLAYLRLRLIHGAIRVMMKCGVPGWPTTMAPAPLG